MKLTILGMNGPFPAPGSATSGYLVTSGPDALMLDMGSGTLQGLCARMAPEHLRALVLSHWHYDHCSDVLPLIYRMEAHVASGGAPLNVYAPVDEHSPVRQAVQASAAFTLHDIAHPRGPPTSHPIVIVRHRRVTHPRVPSLCTHLFKHHHRFVVIFHCH